MINLLQENIEMESHRTIAHLPVPQAGLLFCRPVRRQAGTKANAEKPKELFLANARPRN